MRKLALSIFALCSFNLLSAQTLKTGEKDLDATFAQAVWTIDHNTEGKLLNAGGDYGGEWTRDCSMNAWNAASLLRPDVAEYSLWSVTNDHKTIGHQYWDKIIWVIAAWNHYLVNGDVNFLKEAYACSAATMKELEAEHFDKKTGLFRGPAVFQDGIAAYDEPVFEPARRDRSFVLDHPQGNDIECLSTNSVYYEAYLTMIEMAKELEAKHIVAGQSAEITSFGNAAAALKESVRTHLYDKKDGKLYFLLDRGYHQHDYQEGLGVAYAVMFGILSQKEAKAVLDNCHITEHGIAAVWPCFDRNTKERPGRHNVMIWPQVNMYYASACALVGERGQFWFEVNNLADLALHHSADGKPNFHEIYTEEGRPSGGWQCDHEWDYLNHQTWCATGFLRAIINEAFGLKFTTDGITFSPLGFAEDKAYDNAEGAVLSDIHYRKANLTITLKGNGKKLSSCTINGKSSKPCLPANAEGNYDIVLVMK